MNWQAYNKPADPLFFCQCLEIIAVESSRTPNIIVKRSSDAQLGISQRDANSHRAVVDAGDPYVIRGHDEIRIRWIQSVADFPRFQNVRAQRIAWRTRV